MNAVFDKKIAGDRRGQSLMELLVGMAVGAVLIIGSATIIASSLQSNGQAGNVQVQTQLGQELLNNVKSFAGGNWNGLLALATGTGNPYYLNTSSSPFTAVSVKPTATSTVLVQGPYTNNYSGNSEAYTSNVTAGDALVVSADTNSASTQSISSSGSGCSGTTWTLEGSSTISSSITATTWVGIASATGACTATITPAVSGHNGIFVSEYSGVSTSTPVDSSGSAATTGSVLTVNGSPATSTRGGEYGYTFWADNSAATPSATGWVSLLNNTYDGVFGQSNMSLGTSVSFPGMSFSGGSHAANLVTLQLPASSGGPSGSESVTINNVTYNRSFYISDVYRDSNGFVTSTVSGNFYDPSTKLVTVSVNIASSSAAPLTYSLYLTRNTSNNVDQRSWSGGKVSGAASFVSSTYANASNTVINSAGALQLTTSSVSYSNGYAYNRSITVASSQVSSTLTNFPMLISGTYAYLAASSSGGYAQNANGYDILFTSDASGTTPLKWEVESYTSSTGNLVVWVNIPSLTSSTVIYMFYDNPTITTFQGNATGTWNSNYKAVFHFPASTSTPSVVDSSGNNATTTNHGTTATTTQIGGGIALNGSNQYVDMSNGSGGTMDLNRNFTISAWVNSANPASGAQSILSHGNQGYYFRINSSHLDFLQSQIADLGSNTTALSANTWYYAAITISSSTTATGTFYLNGAANGTISFSSNFNNANYNPAIGSELDGGTEFFNGKLDEVRVQSVAQTPSWILTEYNNQNSPSTFYTISAQNSNGGGGGTPTFVQSAQTGDGSTYGRGRTITFSTSTTAGDTIVVSYMGQDTNTYFAVASDSVNGLYSIAASSSDFDNRYNSAIFYMPNAASISSLTVVPDYSVWEAIAYEYSGLKASPLDRTSTYPGVTYNPVTTWSDPLTTTATGDLIVGVGYAPDPMVLNTTTFKVDWQLGIYGPIFASAIAGSAGTYPYQGTSNDYGRVDITTASFFAGTATPPSASGTLDSQPFDTRSASGTQLNSFTWQGTQPSGTTVKFQFAVSNASSGPWSFMGPDGTSNTYFSGAAGTPVNLVSTTNGYTLFNGYRYFSYRTFLYTSSTAVTPTVSEVSVNWSP